MNHAKTTSFIILLLSSLICNAKSYMGEITIKVGETRTVDVGYGSSGSWSKSNSTFVFVGQGQTSCEIKGNQVGTGTLEYFGVVGASDFELYWTVNVTTDPIVKVSSITLNKSSLSLKVRQEETLTATVRPSDATDKSVTWSIDNPNVATVGSSGMVKAKAEGNATITCKANDGSGVSVTCTLNVEGELPEPETMSIKQVAVGFNHTMILMADGSLWACGKNDHGQLCDGTTTNCNKPKQVMSDVEFVSAGAGHTMIVKSDGSLWACGWNENGQLGNGTYIDCETPEQIMTGVATVSAGAWHTLILKTDGSLWGCGSNSNGQLGDGTKTGRSTPKKITTGVVTMSAGTSHTMIVKNDGSLWTCGSDESGSLAGGPFFTGSSQWLLTPKQAMTGVKSVAAGSDYSMIIKQDNSLWTCGSNSYGCLGVGSRNIYCNTEQIMTNVKDVSAKYYHTLILKTDGSLWACGWNYRGQIGDGTTTDCKSPKKIMTDVSIISAGSMHSVAVKTDGSLWVWGKNDSGQLGDGTNTDRYSPVKIDFDILVTSVILNKTSLSLLSGQEETLTATIAPNNAKDKSVTWTSSTPSVATVSNTGTVTAKEEGTTIITCAANDGSGIRATCTVVVKNPVKPKRISLPETATVASGQTITLIPEITPANAETTLTWKSRNEAIATVDDNGVVTGVKEGNTFITVETDNGLSAYCKLTVTKPAPPEPTKIEIPEELTVGVGQKLKVDYTLTPENAETTVTWTIDDEKVATIDGDGFLTGKAEGLAVLTATTANGLTSNHCYITVTAAAVINADVNGDGSVDVADISSIISVMAGQSGNITEKSADVNNDGTVDVADIASVITRMAELARQQQTIAEEE